MNHSKNQEIFIISFFNCSGLDLPLKSGSVHPHISADPDPGSKNLADPKQWVYIWGN